jgi:P27 family predicted phage terminase small subunit
MPRRGRKPKPKAPPSPAARPDVSPTPDVAPIPAPVPAPIPAPVPAENHADAAAEFTRRVRLSLASLTLDGPAMDHVLELLSEMVERWKIAQASLRQHGPVVQSAHGSLKPNPAAAQAAKASDQIARVLAELGLTPAALARMGAKPETDDDFDAFLRETR